MLIVTLNLCYFVNKIANYFIKKTILREYDYFEKIMKPLIENNFNV